MKEKNTDNFRRIFPHLAQAFPGRIAGFAKVSRVISDYAKEKLRKEITKLDVFSFIDERGVIGRDFLQYLAEYYPNELTRSSQLSLLKKLAGDELKLIAESETLESQPALSGLVAVDKLQPHMKELWLILPREGGRGLSREARSNYAITDVGKLVFKAWVAVNARHQISSLSKLISDHCKEFKQEVRSTVKHGLRRRVIRASCDVARKIGITSFKTNAPALKPEQLPAKLRSRLEVFEERARKGLAAYDDLKPLAAKYQFKKVEPLSPLSVRRYRDAFLTGAAYLELDDELGIEDLLRLESKVVGEDKRVVHFNKYVDRYRDAERAVVRDGYKTSHYDSVSFGIFVNAICVIARFNGIFHLQAEFRSNYKVRIDRATKKLRKSLKKTRMPRGWIDAEIRQLKVEFDEIVRKKTFLTNRKDLRLCLFLPQLVTLRYLGYRQQCLKKCLIGKNIKVGPNKSITFHYEPGEIKNEVLIHQTLSAEGVAGIKELVILIDVLTKYKSGVLDVISSKFPEPYEMQMGRSFFGFLAPSGNEGLIVKYSVGKEDDSLDAWLKADKKGRSEVIKQFESAAYEFMDFDSLVDLPYDFNPHFLRAVCCDWMRKDLGLSWEEISKAMGDLEDTLKREYYEEDRRVQDAAPAFSRVSRERLAVQAAAGENDSVSAGALPALQQAMAALTDQLKRTEERAERAEKELAKRQNKNKVSIKAAQQGARRV